MGRALGGMKTIKRVSLVLFIVWVLLLGLGVTLVAANSEQPDPTVTSPVEIPEPPALMGANGCKTVWLTEPTYYEELRAGAKRCLVIPRSGWAKVHRFDNVDKPVFDYHNRYHVTTVRPNGGFGTYTAKRVNRLAAKHNVRLQFARVDFSGRSGCNKYFPGVSGNYRTSSHYGKGLIRLGTGKTSWCLKHRPQTVLNVAKHEISHAIIERKCKPYRGIRNEHLTDAYAYRYLKATSKRAGNYGFTKYDMRRAIKVHRGDC